LSRRPNAGAPSGHQTVLILDFGSQYTQLIARRVRENRVYCEVHPCDLDVAAVRELEPIGIVLSVLFESIRFFEAVPIFSFLFGLEWSPQMAIRADQVGSSGAFGAVPLFAGTLLISAIAMIVAVPIVRDALGWSWPGPGLVMALGWLLVASTLVSMFDRLRLLLLRRSPSAGRTAPDSPDPGTRDRSPR